MPLCPGVHILELQPASLNGFTETRLNVGETGSEGRLRLVSQSALARGEPGVGEFNGGVTGALIELNLDKFRGIWFVVVWVGVPGRVT